jgi:hypothetical protein
VARWVPTAPIICPPHGGARWAPMGPNMVDPVGPNGPMHGSDSLSTDTLNLAAILKYKYGYVKMQSYMLCRP